MSKKLLVLALHLNLLSLSISLLLKSVHIFSIFTTPLQSGHIPNASNNICSPNISSSIPGNFIVLVLKFLEYQ